MVSMHLSKILPGADTAFNLGTYLGCNPDIAEQIFNVFAIEQVPEEHLVAGQGLPIEDEGNRPRDVIAEGKGFQGCELGRVDGAIKLRFGLSVDGKDFAHLKYRGNGNKEQLN